jgi:spermidine synthase
MESPTEEPKVVYKAPSPFGTVFVVDEGDERTLRFDHPDGNRQSAMLKSNPQAVLSNYVRVATAGLAFAEGRSRALVVGLGGGALPLLLHRCLPRMVVDVVELNPVVVDVARRFFGVREDERLHITVEDGAEFMKRQGPSYDFILLDAFSDKGIPGHLKKSAFFEDVLRRLAPGGAVVLNIALGIRERKARLRDTFIQVFEECARLKGDSSSANLLLVGTPGPLPSESVFRQELWKLARELRFPELARSVKGFEPHPTGPL